MKKKRQTRVYYNDKNYGLSDKFHNKMSAVTYKFHYDPWRSRTMEVRL